MISVDQSVKIADGIFKKMTTFFNFQDMFRCYEHHRQLQNI